MEMSHLALTSVSRRLTLTVQCLMQEILLVCVCVVLFVCMDIRMCIVCVLAYNVCVLCMFAFVCECVCVSLCVFCLLAYVCMCV